MGICSIFFLVACIGAFIIAPDSFVLAQQDFQDWHKKQQGEFESYKKEEDNKFQEFKDKRDSAFVEFLKKEWQAMQLTQTLLPAKEPKPAVMPIIESHAIPKEALLQPSKTIKEIQMLEPPLEKSTDSMESLLAKFAGEGESLSFSFFDASFIVNYDKALKDVSIAETINESAISTFWAEMSRAKYEDLLQQAQVLREQMKLNDWGYCLILDKIGTELYPSKTNKARLFIWYMLAKSGYDVKVGFCDNSVYLLLPSKNIIYGSPYFIMDGKKYYVVTFGNISVNAKSISTYSGNYPDAQHLIAMALMTLPMIRQSSEEKLLKFTYDNKEYKINLKLKKDAIDFCDKYPQTDLDVYFNAPLSADAQSSMLRDLKTIIEGKTEAEAVNILLRFVQTAFEYKSDKSQFGREKPFFAEETLFYPFSDCEDRSVLFAYLVQKLIGLHVVGLDYPGHIATAVNFSTDIEGDSIIYNGKKYLICDATYINANIGQVLKQYQAMHPKIIQLASTP